VYTKVKNEKWLSNIVFLIEKTEMIVIFSFSTSKKAIFESPIFTLAFTHPMGLQGCFWSLTVFIQPQFIDGNRVAIYQCGHDKCWDSKSGTRKGGVAVSHRGFWDAFSEVLAWELFFCVFEKKCEKVMVYTCSTVH
jgi:hypothetical protein